MGIAYRSVLKDVGTGGVHIDSVTITSYPNTTTYMVGDKLDLSGLKIYAEIGSLSGNVTNDCTFTPANGDILTASTTKVTVKYGNEKLDIPLTVVMPTAITITSQPTKTTYKTDEPLDFTGLTVTASNSEAGISADVTSACIFNPAEGTTLDEEKTYTISVSYGSLSTSFDVVCQNLPAIYNTVKNASTVTEAQWLEFCEASCIKLARDNADTASFIGKNITLSNTAQNTYTSWKIADFNHDNSGDTCDVIQNNTIYNTRFNDSSNYYNSSEVRTWLNNTYYNGFNTNIKNKLQTMSVASNGSILNDKVKLLSFTEVNGSTGTSSTNYVTEGTKYPIFTDDNSRKRTGISSGWWVRSCYTIGPADVWGIHQHGSLYYSNYRNNTAGLVPVIRFV